MAVTIHSNARTTPKIRREIQASPSSVTNAALARKYGLTKHAVSKWCKRESVEDGSHRPNKLHTTLMEAQETVVVSLRELLLLSLEDLLVVSREFHMSGRAIGSVKCGQASWQVEINKSFHFIAI